MKFKGFVSSLSLLFLLGSGLLTFFIILSGAKTTGVLKEFYWFEADTSGLNNAASTTRWFNYKSCGYENGKYLGCSSTKAAYPFSPKDNFGSSTNMPSPFENNRDTFYYLSRVGWAMLLIGLFFLIIALVPVLISVFKSGVSAVLSTVALWVAFFFITLSACLYTGCYVKGRSDFRDDGRSAKLNIKMFAFLWTTVFLLLLSALWSLILSVIFGVKKAKGSKDYHQYEGGSSRDDSYIIDKQTYDSRANSDPQKGRWWKIHFKKTTTTQV